MAKKKQGGGGGTAKKAGGSAPSSSVPKSAPKPKGGVVTPRKKAQVRAARRAMREGWGTEGWSNQPGGFPTDGSPNTAGPWTGYPGDQNGASAGGNTPPPPPPPPPTGPSADEISLFERTITSILRQYGLNTPGMIGYLKGLLIEDKISDNPSEVELMGYLYDQPDFRARFPSIAAQADKQKNGWAGEVMSPRAVLEYEATLRNALASYGVDGYDVKTTASNLILGDVSANEAAMRVSLAAYAATTGPREVADALMQHEGIGPGDLVSFYLNPDKATKEIERKHATAQMQAWQRQQGLQQDWGFSEQVVAQGIQNDQAQAAFAQAAMQKNITSGYGETTTESDTKKAALGMSSQSEQSVRRSLSSRQGSFNKSGGAAESQTGVSGLRSSK